MTHIYRGAITILNLRIKQCGVALSSVSNEYDVLYWNKELALAQFKAYNIKKRLKVEHNVIKIDFLTKKRVA